MSNPVQKWHCPYCDRVWETEEEAAACAKYPYEVLEEGDVLNWRRYRYGMVRDVHDQKDWAGFSAKRNKDYCIAMGFSPRDMFGYGDSVCYAKMICGGKEVHDSLLMETDEAEKIVKDLRKRLKCAETLLADVKKMWERRGGNV